MTFVQTADCGYLAAGPGVFSVDSLRLAAQDDVFVAEDRRGAGFDRSEDEAGRAERGRFALRRALTPFLWAAACERVRAARCISRRLRFAA
jgi:hypothetical protein